MQLFLIIPTLLATGAAAEHHWLESGERYGYQGPPAPLSSDGRVVDTPEVAHAKAAHLATHAEVIASMEHDAHNEVWEEPNDVKYAGHPHVIPQHYHGPPAPLGHDGRVIDTTEVAQAKAAHLAAHAQAAAKATAEYDYHGLHNEIWDDRGSQHPDANNHYSGPVAYVHHHSPVVYKGPPAPLAPDGRVLDTPEVAKAKEAHLRAHAYAAALNAHRDSQLFYH